jgi:hypothetical protein
MKLLFLARHFTYFRNFESVIRTLASRGHVLHLAAERDNAIGGSALVERLAAELPGVTFGELPRREADEATLATKLRLALDYTRYLEPMYDAAPRLRSRAAERAPLFAERFGGSRVARSRVARAALRRALASAEAAVPSVPSIEAYISAQRPDAVLVTPLIGVVGSSQPDYLRAAKRLRIPTALCVWSWDHLSSKALIRDLPDRVFVWNDVQRDEAERLHRVPPARIVVTGAQCFDQWFGRAPSRTREVFCSRVGLPADRPFVLYVGSALFGGSPSEAAFALRWIRALRDSGDVRLREAGVLVRPHPQRTREWDGVDLAGLGRVVVWGGNPITDEARADYFDSLYYSAAVVGLNTSAFLEAAIAGRPVLAILPPEFRDNQEGTIHFHYLTGAGGGLLRTSRTLEEHAAQLASALAEPAAAGRHEAFLRAFIRPRGLDTPATPVFASAVEALAGLSVPPAPSPSLAGRAALAVLHRVAASRRFGRWLSDDEERRAAAWRQAKAEARAEHRRSGLTDQQRADAEERMRAQRTTP